MYKNWKNICQIEDIHFMWALALLDLTTDFGRMVVKRFPEYFSSKQQAGPVPWSLIKKKAVEKNGVNADLAPVTFDGFRGYDIPILEFRLSGGNEKYPPTEIENWLNEGHSQGDILDWEGKKLIFVEDSWSDGNDWACFAPAELIAMDK